MHKIRKFGQCGEVGIQYFGGIFSLKMWIFACKSLMDEVWRRATVDKPTL